MIYDSIQLPPLAGARSTAPEPTASADAVPPAGFPPVSLAGGNSIPSGRDGAAAAQESDSPCAAVATGGAALDAIAAERRRQIAKFGHTPEADAALPLKQLPREAARFITMVIEDCQYQNGDWRKAARRHLIRAGALVLAAIDRLDAEPPAADTFAPDAFDQP